ncbi:MAG: anthranilate synthase component I family protein [Bacteroidetes bacterium]|nr:anthranilate synthase component I family protein [Bacteroidota bacterium]
MKKIKLSTSFKKLPADLYTPVGIYLRLRDKFRDTILLESTDHHTSENSFSFIAINAIGGIEISSAQTVEFKYPLADPETIHLSNDQVPDLIWKYMCQYEVFQQSREEVFAQGLYGYTTFDAVRFFETVLFKEKSYQLKSTSTSDFIPLMRYRLYQFVIAIDHHKDEMMLLENHVEGIEGGKQVIEDIIHGRDLPQFPFNAVGDESSNMTDQSYIEMVQKGIAHCHRGDVFQIVLSRRFEQAFKGDEFNVYRALRMINPSPYLFYFDYGEYRLLGSSPESQLIVGNGKATVHPIAGTFKRTGDDAMDRKEAERLLQDPKENAEHVMLVDLARNDLSRVCENVQVSQYRQVKFYSHVIHLVSEVTGTAKRDANPFSMMSNTFPAGTLSGAPKYKAMELIDTYEPTKRSFYGGAIGMVGFNGSFNHAILIRSFLSKNNTLYYQAGAGVVASSVPEKELQEVINKLGALKKAIQLASTIHQS